MNEEYLTAAAIVAVVVMVAIGGYILLSKMGFARQRQTLPTIVGMNDGLFILLSKYKKWRIVDMADREAVERLYRYFNHGLNSSFRLTIKVNDRGIKVLKSHKRGIRKS